MCGGPASPEVGLQLQLRQAQQRLCKTGLRASLWTGGCQDNGVPQNSIFWWNVVIHGNVVTNGAFKWKEPKNSFHCESLIKFTSLFVRISTVSCITHVWYRAQWGIQSSCLLSAAVIHMLLQRGSCFHTMVNFWNVSVTGKQLKLACGTSSYLNWNAAVWHLDSLLIQQAFSFGDKSGGWVLFQKCCFINYLIAYFSFLLFTLSSKPFYGTSFLIRPSFFEKGLNPCHSKCGVPCKHPCCPAYG